MGHIELMQCRFLTPGLIAELRAKHPHNSGRLEQIKSASEAIWAKEGIPDSPWGQDASAGLVSAASGERVDRWVEKSEFGKGSSFSSAKALLTD